MVSHPRLNTLLGADVHVKLENTQPVGAFKIRGGLNLLMTASPRGSARWATSPQPEATTDSPWPTLARALRVHACSSCRTATTGPRTWPCALWAQTYASTGSSFDEAWAAAEAYAKEHGSLLVHPGKEQKLVAGVGTWVLELLEQVDAPARRRLRTRRRRQLHRGHGHGHQSSEPSHPGHRRPKCGGPRHDLGVARRRPPPDALRDLRWPTASPWGQPVAETLAVMAEHVDDMVLVDEDELARAMRWYATTLGQLAEGAGAAALAGAFALRPRFRGGRIAVLLSGGNVDLLRLREVFGQGGLDPRGER